MARGKTADRPVDLRGQAVTQADVDSGNLMGADLRGSDLHELDLSKQILRGADAAGASFFRATLEEADLRGADLRGADLSRACLRGARIQGALFDGADAMGADVTGVIWAQGAARCSGLGYAGSGERLPRLSARATLVDVPEPLAAALAELRPMLLDRDRLRRAVAAGRRRGHEVSWRRAELRPVRLKSGTRLQVVTYDEWAAHTRNEDYERGAPGVVDALLAEPFASWHVEAIDTTVQLRVTKRGEAQVHREAADAATLAASAGEHDRVRPHLLDPGDPLFDVLGASAAKRRQVDAFLRVLDPVLPAERPDRPLRVVDLGCGNAYLTFAAHRYLTAARGRRVELVGVDAKEQARQRNTALAARLDGCGGVRFVEGPISDVLTADLGFAADADSTANSEGDVDVVLALHACDTATDEALARAIRWRAPLVLAAPCCHHDLQRQLSDRAAPSPYGLLTRHGILRERFADVLTDSLRAALLRLVGYRVDVVEFVDSAHTARNVLIRAERTGAPPTADTVGDYRALRAQWSVRPALERLLADDLPDVLG